MITNNYNTNTNSNNNNDNDNLENEIEQTNTITMNLENLQQQYSNLLISYQQAITNYVNYLNQLTSNGGNDQYIALQGQAFNGTGSAGESKANTLPTCIASCSNLSTCTGATFVSNQCLIRTGDSPIVPSSQDSYAIIPESKSLLLNIENINNQLIFVNQQITNIMSNANPLYASQVSQRFQKQQTLISNYEKLMEERKKIQDLLKEYETLDNTESSDKIMINRNYYTYILLLFLAIAVIFTLYKIALPISNTSSYTTQTIQYGGDLGMNAYFIVFCIILFMFIVNYIIQYKDKYNLFSQ
jgi:hypothetical protein